MALAAVLALASCTQGEGPVADETREVAAFTRIEAADDFVVADPVVVDVVIPSIDGGIAQQRRRHRARWPRGRCSRRLPVGRLAGYDLRHGDERDADGQGGSTASLGDLDAGTVTVSLEGGATAEVQARDSVQGSASGGATLRVRGRATIQVDAFCGAQVSNG